MKIVTYYDFNHGLNAIKSRYPAELDEIKKAIDAVDASRFKTKKSQEKTMPGRILYSPSEINKEFRSLLNPLGWQNCKVPCEYTQGERLEGYMPVKSSGAFRDMDFVKKDKKLGVEVQFGKYAFMVYNVCAKMTIFKNLGIIDAGIEIIPVKNFSDEMSTGVSYFEQFAWDLTMRGVSNIDIPVLILGIDA